MTGESELTNKYELCDEIGRGRFGTITRCYSSISNEFYACKTIDKSGLTDALDRECLEMEPKIMTLLSPHSNIIQIYDCFESDDSLSIIMELFDPPVTIFDRLISSGPFSEQDTASFGKQILSALAHCHRYGVVHRDVKLENIMVDLCNGAVKLCDFGSAVWLAEGSTTRGVVGTPYCLAPEVVMGRDYNEKVDVWSAGVVLYTMIAGTTPFCGETAEEVFDAVLRGNLRFPPRIFRSVSAEAKDLLRKMICKDASRRISAEEALCHPWIVNGGD